MGRKLCIVDFGLSILRRNKMVGNLFAWNNSKLCLLRCASKMYFHFCFHFSSIHSAKNNVFFFQNLGFATKLDSNWFRKKIVFFFWKSSWHFRDKNSIEKLPSSIWKTRDLNEKYNSIKRRNVFMFVYLLLLSSMV